MTSTDIESKYDDPNEVRVWEYGRDHTACFIASADYDDHSYSHEGYFEICWVSHDEASDLHHRSFIRFSDIDQMKEVANAMLKACKKKKKNKN